MRKMGTLKNCSFTITDDGNVMGNGISLLIKDLFLHTTIDNAENFEEMLQVLKVVKIKVLLLDLSSTKDGTLSIIENIKRIQPEIKILLCTVKHQNSISICYYGPGDTQYVDRHSREIKKLLSSIDLVDESATSNMKDRILNYLLLIKQDGIIVTI